MKHLCCNKIILLFLLFGITLFGSVKDKSAIVYYGEHISYPLVGIHDYIIVEPNNIDTYRHGFEVYKNKMYAYVSIGEIDVNDPAYKKLDKTLIVGKNAAWKSKLLNLTNPHYKEFLFNEMIEPQIKKGFQNFFFDTLDSYQLVAKTKKARQKNEAALVDIIHSFHQRYPHAKLILNRGFEIIDKVHNDINAMLFESYYRGVGGKNLAYKDVSKDDREWLDIQLKKVQKYPLDIICVDYLPLNKIQKEAKPLIKKLQKKGFIPYVATKELNSYGYSSKNALKREILTLINDTKVNRIEQSAHLYGAVPLEYLGYIQKLYNVDKKPLPTMAQMQRYGGVVIWLNKNYNDPEKLMEWIEKVRKFNIKIVFASSFSMNNLNLLKPLNIINKEMKTDIKHTYTLLHKDSMIGYEMSPPLNTVPYLLEAKNGEVLYSVKDEKGEKTTLAAIMPWGGYAIEKAFMIELSGDNLWTINPFKFFQKALRLPKIPAPDVTTENGKRIFFSHIDGDGIANRVEWDPELFSGNTIYSDILSQYKVPISVSVIGSEINKNGLFPKLSPQLIKIVKKMFALPNVEPATHTFTHPFFWNKIINGNLDEKYRLKPKGYKFSLNYEIKGMLDEINEKLLPPNKTPKARTIFWSGDCTPPAKILKYVYKNHILNLNGGDTTITNLHPWLSNIAPLGLERAGYYQIYTGEQNENIYTNEWLGPFWGFKKVVQTFKLTNSPRRLKPIDIYYHLYSGSKRASINALKYVYDWTLKQDVNPIFASEYIRKVMDFYTLSIAEDHKSYLFSGLKHLKTVRLDNMQKKEIIQLNNNIAGYSHFENHTYIHMAQNDSATIEKKLIHKQNNPYLIEANGKVVSLKREEKRFYLKLQSHIPLKTQLFIPKNWQLKIKPQPKVLTHKKNIYTIKYQKNTRAEINVFRR
jgi:hypothetical protein